MSLDHQLHSRIRFDATIRPSSLKVFSESDQKPASHPIDVQRFPSSTINNETFMNIDDTWPNEADSSKKCSFIYFTKWKLWALEHKKLSVVFIVIVILVILVIGAVLVTVFVVIKKSSEGSLTTHPSTPTPSSSTTEEVFGTGGLSYAKLSHYYFNFTLSDVSLRPDRRNSGGFILKNNNTLSFLRNCETPFLLKTVWQIDDIIDCQQVTAILKLDFEDENCTRCDVLDVLEECRSNNSLCDYSSFIYCCNNCSSGDSFCSVYGMRYTIKNSVLLDVKFEILDNKNFLLRFSTVNFYLLEFCFLQSQIIFIKNGQVDSNVYPFQKCPPDYYVDDNVTTVAIYQNVNETDEGWKAMLSDDGTLYISDLHDANHLVSGLVGGLTAKLYVDSNNGCTLIADLADGQLSVVRILNFSISVAQPRQIDFKVPGNFVDGFLDGENLFVYNIYENSIYIAEMDFFWN